MGAVVYKGDVNVNYGPLNGSLKGDTLGVVALEVLSVTPRTGAPRGALPSLDVMVLASDAVCGEELMLLSDAPTPISSSNPFDVAP